jgi:hypothetical protein
MNATVALITVAIRYVLFSGLVLVVGLTWFAVVQLWSTPPARRTRVSRWRPPEDRPHPLSRPVSNLLKVSSQLRSRDGDIAIPKILTNEPICLNIQLVCGTCSERVRMRCKRAVASLMPRVVGLFYYREQGGQLLGAPPGRGGDLLPALCSAGPPPRRAE